MKQLFLPLGLALSVVFSFTLPDGGILIANNYGTKILVFLIFLVSGYQTGSKGLALGKDLTATFLAAAFISLILGPILGLITAKIFSFPFYLAMGLIIASTVPPTLSSGVVITGVSRGNTSLALFLTITLNLLGIISIPFILDLSLKAAGPIDIDQFSLLVKMLFFVLFPLLIGKVVAIFFKKNTLVPFLPYVNSSCVILIIYASLATSRDALATLTLLEYILILSGVASVHLLLLLTCYFTGISLKLNSADTKALVFVTSQKTLPIAIAILANIKIDTGNAIIVCLIFHFFQLFTDSLLAVATQNR